MNPTADKRSGNLGRLPERLSGPLTFLCLCIALLGCQGAETPEVLSPNEPPAVFGGGARSIPLLWHNPTGHHISVPISLELWQVQSSIAMPLGDVPWKELQVLPGQTVLESAAIEVPVVRAQTRFLARWVDARSEILGVSEFVAYPTNLLRELQVLGGPDPVGVYDPTDQLKPLLSLAGVEYTDLQEEGFDRHYGRLLIVGPFNLANPQPGWLATAIQSRARKGAAVVWVTSAQEDPALLTPSFFSVSIGKGVVIVAEPSLIKDLAQNPRSQLRLVELCRIAITRRVPLLPSILSNR
ncbi:MAG TPA: hypothetical protein VKY92_03725 [Verrucomicrobiae bacterium]|nr:hypothetical protein [Verrucomicrobiae bacterium]